MTPLPGPFTLRESPDVALDAERDTAERIALLAAVGEGRSDQVVRLTRPRPTAAFSRRDALLPGYAEAVRTAARHGFAPVLRPVGGRMAPYHQGCLVLDVIGRSDDPPAGTAARFDVVAGAIVTALRSLGVDARVGAVPREYCPGQQSVNAAGTTKLAGTAQRLRRRAYLVSTLLVVEDSAPLRAVTTDVYAALGLDLDSRTVGSVADVAPGTTVTQVRDALVAALAQVLDLTVVTAGTLAP